MKLENQVCMVGQGERLKELGVIQESLFYYTHSDWGIMPKSSIDFSGNPTSLYSVAELGVMLPKHDDCVGVYYTIQDVGVLVEDKSQGYDVEGFSIVDAYPETDKDKNETTLPPCKGVWHTEAQARAAMLIYLLENNIITSAEVNTRLSDLS